MTELLAPAGTLEKLEWGIAYGADAVYFGIKHGSLRSFAGNFTLEDAQSGMDYLRSRGKKGYCTLNIYPFSEEYDKLIESAKALEEIGVDALIVADLGLLFELKKNNISVPVHISTQANSVSYQTALAYSEMGAKRVNLARELSFERISEIQAELKGHVETEVFIHGAVCFSYSGRCAISDYLTGRRANRGECAQACRWKYHLVEEERPGEYHPVFEDERGHYFYNSKDLALFPFLPGLVDIGVNSLKIEGRMKSIHYIASVVSLYRQVLDGKVFTEEEGFDLLSKVKNRGYSYGFMKGGVSADDYAFDKQHSGANSTFVGSITEKKDGFSVCFARNRIEAGETLEVLSPGGEISQITMPIPLTLDNGEEVEKASAPFKILLNDALEPFSILRRVH